MIVILSVNIIVFKFSQQVLQKMRDCFLGPCSVTRADVKKINTAKSLIFRHFGTPEIACVRPFASLKVSCRMPEKSARGQSSARRERPAAFAATYPSPKPAAQFDIFFLVR